MIISATKKSGDRRDKSPAVNIFEAVKDRVSARQAALKYGFAPSKNGMMRCPFHNDVHASCVVYPGKRGFYCFGCHQGGSVIDFTAMLYGLSPVEAVRKLDADFDLGLGSGVAPDRDQLEHKREIETYFTDWCNETIRNLCASFRTAEQALQKDPDQWTESETLAVKNQGFVDYCLEQLNSDNRDSWLLIWRIRKEVEDVCLKILTRPEKRGILIQDS